MLSTSKNSVDLNGKYQSDEYRNDCYVMRNTSEFVVKIVAKFEWSREDNSFNPYKIFFLVEQL